MNVYNNARNCDCISSSSFKNRNHRKKKKKQQQLKPVWTIKRMSCQGVDCILWETLVAAEEWEEIHVGSNNIDHSWASQDANFANKHEIHNHSTVGSWGLAK